MREDTYLAVWTQTLSSKLFGQQGAKNKILIQKHLEQLRAQEAVEQTQRGFKRIK